MKYIDLHTHSTASDGSLTPAQLVTLAHEKGLSAVALTDHDTIVGLKEAMETGKDLDIEVVPGIEFAAYYKGRDIHLVGLYIDYENPEFKAGVSAIKDNRVLRNQEMIEAMAADGIDISRAKLEMVEGEGILTRANIASYLRHIGLVKTNQEAFDKYIGDDKPYYIPRKKITPEYAIDLILKSKGVPILAHPLLYPFTDKELAACIETLIPAGLKGLEVYYAMNSGDDERRMKRLAKTYGLLFSGGSDFHGSYKPHIQLGTGRGRLFIPEEVLQPIKDAAKNLNPSVN